VEGVAEVKRETIIVVAIIVLLAGGGTAVIVKSRSEFLKLIADEVRRHLSELRPDLSVTRRVLASRIVAAQAALESGYGRTRAFREGWNAWNVSKGSSWTGPTIPGGDTEYDADGNVKKIRQEWRKYGSLREAVSDLFALLSWTRYRPARDALLNGDALAYAEKLRAGGFYTAPVDHYAAGITAAMKLA